MQANIFNSLNGADGSREVYVASKVVTGTFACDPIVIAAAPTEYSTTEATLIITNTATHKGMSTSHDNKQYVHPLYIRMAVNTISSAAARVQYVSYLDNTNRYSSGGTALTSVSTYVDSRANWQSRTPKALVYFGAITAAAESTEDLQVGVGLIKDATMVVGDVYEIRFDGSGVGNIANLNDATNGGHYSVNHMPVHIGPGCSYLLHLILPSAATNGAQFWPEIGYIETGHPRR